MSRYCIFVLAAACLALVGLNQPLDAAAEEEPIIVGSKIDTEGSLLGQMILLVLEDEGLNVTDKTEFGPTPIVRKAINAGEIDIYPEYTGNGAIFFEDTDTPVWQNREQGYERVKSLDYEENNLVWLTPAPADNSWALAVRRDFALGNGLRTLDDLAQFIETGGEIKLAACEEFVTREDALPAFEQAYDFSLSEDKMVVFSGCNTAQTEKAAARGTSGVNTAMAFGTDGSLSALDLRVLEDTKGVQPVYAPTPVVREDALEAHPQIEEILAPVFESLSQETLQELNSKIAVGGQNPGKVAKTYLQDNDFL
ncbi:MAG: glycine betaine ABC transporter substrate-binding protein OsmF [Thermodesulfobacteriota bacterium]